MNAKEFEDKVYNRCLEVQKYGYTIVSNNYGIYFSPLNRKFILINKKFVCPLGACLLNSPCQNSSILEATIDYFNVSEQRVHSFIEGVDGVSPDLSFDKEFYKAGKSIRKRLGIR